MFLPGTQNDDPDGGGLDPSQFHELLGPLNQEGKCLEMHRDHGLGGKELQGRRCLQGVHGEGSADGQEGHVDWGEVITKTPWLSH